MVHFGYGAMAGGLSGSIGGVQRQTSLLARWFAERGYEVSMLTWDEGQEDGVKISGVRILKMCRENAGIKGLRFFWPKWTSLNTAMRRADADVYYQNCAEYVTGQVALWCHRHGRKFIYSVANDPDCDAQLPEMRKVHDRLFYWYGLRTADKVIVQTVRQREMLQNHFQRDSVVIPMPCPGPSESEYVRFDRERGASQHVLWIGRVCEQKRPDRLLDLAWICPDVHFDLVGPIADTEYSRGICLRAGTIRNVTLHGPVSRDHIPEFFRNTRVMCCTSDFEGFPNTFLEAWCHGVPIVSTVDPDNVIAERGLGIVGKDVSELASGIHELLRSPEKWKKASQSARAYYRDNHALEKAMERFERIFCEVTDPGGRGENI